MEQLDLSGYELILSNNHAVAKGVMVGPDQLHISYINSPMRYAWDLHHQYLRESGLDQRWIGWLVRYLLCRLRSWDVRTSLGVDAMLANSRFIRRRIQRVYGRDSTVIYPPVDVDTFQPQGAREDFYLAASRMVPYKRMDLIVEAFTRMPNRRLVVIGDGPNFKKVQKMAGPNVELLGYQPTAILRDHMQRAKGFVFAAEEDFGIMPVEAQACGTPVIAYGKGGSLETVRGLGNQNEAPTGVFFREQSPESLIEAIGVFEAAAERFDTATIRRHAEKFSAARFRAEYSAFVSRTLEEWRAAQ
jgi:glycosyltransferase involved in cell wall biosynthesis